MKHMQHVAQDFSPANLAGLKTCATFFLLLASCFILFVSCGNGSVEEGDNGGGGGFTISVSRDSALTNQEVRDSSGVTIFDERGNLVGVGTRPYDPCVEKPCAKEGEEETPEIRKQTSVLWPAKRQ